MNYTPEDLLEYLYTAPKLREDALHALSHNDILNFLKISYSDENHTRIF